VTVVFLVNETQNLRFATSSPCKVKNYFQSHQTSSQIIINITCCGATGSVGLRPSANDSVDLMEFMEWCSRSSWSGDIPIAIS